MKEKCPDCDWPLTLAGPVMICPICLWADGKQLLQTGPKSWSVVARTDFAVVPRELDEDILARLPWRWTNVQTFAQRPFKPGLAQTAWDEAWAAEELRFKKLPDLSKAHAEWRQRWSLLVAASEPRSLPEAEGNKP